MAINTSSNPLKTGSFVPTTNIWDIASQISSLEKVDPALKDFLVILYQNINNIALVLNTKTSGFYVLSEFVDGNVWFPNPANSSQTPTAPALRQEQIKTFYWTTSLGVNTTTTIPHGITVTPLTTFTDIYAVANDTTNFLYAKISYASNTTGKDIEIYCDNINIYIITGSAPLSTTFNITYIVLKYLQN